MTEVQLMNSESIAILLETTKQLAKDLKKMKNIKEQLGEIQEHLETVAATKRQFIEVSETIVHELAVILMENELQPYAIKAFSCVNFMKLNALPEIQNLAPNTVEQLIIDRYLDIIIQRSDLNVVLTSLIKSKISVKNHMDLLFAAAIVLEESAVPLYVASSSISLKFHEMPELFLTFLKSFLKYIKNDDVVFSERFEEADEGQFKSQLIDIFHVVLDNFPFEALRSEAVTDLFLDIYNGMLFEVPVLSPVPESKWLFAIEKILRIFLGIFPAHVIFDHFHSFVFRVLDFQEIPHFELKAGVLMHVARLICHDNLEFSYFGVCDQQMVEDIQSKIEQEFFDPFTAELDVQSELLHFQYFERANLPPGEFLIAIFHNFDTEFSMPDLSQQIVRKITEQIAYFEEFESKEQKEAGQAVQLESYIVNYRNYYIELAKAAQRYETRLMDGNSYFNQIQKFLESCGILDAVKMTFVNQNMEGQGSAEYYYQATNYLEAIQHTLARVLDSYSEVYSMQEFNAEFVESKEDYGFFEDKTEIEDTLELKLKMKAGFEVFDESPLKAVKQFEEMGNLISLRQIQKREDETPTDSAAPKRVRRTFEQEFEHNQQLINDWKAKYENADEWCADIIKFVMEHVKEFDFNVGISEAAFGELIGGSKIENRAILHYFSDYFRDTQLNAPGIEFVQALRVFLSYFKLPGEGQVIDRIMNAFSHQYSVYSGLDHKTLHGLSYAVIMLNTDLHNTSIKSGRMTKDMFITNTKLIDYAKELSSEMLSTIYDEISANPFTLGSIEDSKKKFAILQKYFYVDERDVNAQSEQQQEQEQQEKNDDPEAEQMRLIPRIIRYNMAFQEYIKFGFHCFNPQEQTIEDFQIVQREFNSVHFQFIIQQLGSFPVEKLLKLTRKVPRSWTTQLCLENLLKVYLSKDLGLTSLRQEVIQLYIDYSTFLDVPILQRPKFDDSVTYFEVVSQRARTEKIDQIPKIDESRLDLIEFVIEFASYRLIADNSSRFFIPQAEFGDAYQLLSEIMSRCVYFDLLFQRAIPQTARETATVPLEGFKVDCAEFLTTRSERSESIALNYVQIFEYFERLGTVEKVKKIIVNASSLPPCEFKHFSLSLAKSAEFEEKIYLNVEYSQFSLSRLISTLSVKLEESIEEFEQLFISSSNSFTAVLLTQNERLGSSVAIQIHQLVLQYLVLEMRQVTGERASQPIFDEILVPFANALQQSAERYMILMIVEFIAVYLSLFEISRGKQNDFFRALGKEDGKDDALTALAEYYSEPMPKSLLHAFIYTITASASSFIRENNEFLKTADNSLSYEGKIIQLFQREHVSSISEGICDLHFRLSELMLGRYDDQLMAEYLQALTTSREIQDNQNNYAPILFKACKKALFFGFNIDNQFASDSNHKKLIDALYQTLQDDSEEKRRMNQSLVKDLIDEVQRTTVCFDDAKQRFLETFAGHCIEHFEFDAKTDHCGHILAYDDECLCQEYQHSFLEWIRGTIIDNIELRRFVFQKMVQFVKTVNCGSFITMLKYIILRSNDYKTELDVLEEMEQFESFGSYCLVFNYYLQVVKNPELISRAINIYSEMLLKYSHQMALEDLQEAVELIYHIFSEEEQEDTSKSVQALVSSQLAHRELQGRTAALSFIKSIVSELFQTHFKKQIYGALLEICEDEDLEVRKQLKRVLLDRYSEQ